MLGWKGEKSVHVASKSLGHIATRYKPETGGKIPVSSRIVPTLMGLSVAEGPVGILPRLNSANVELFCQLHVVVFNPNKSLCPGEK